MIEQNQLETQMSLRENTENSDPTVDVQNVLRPGQTGTAQAETRKLKNKEAANKWQTLAVHPRPQND